MSTGTTILLLLLFVAIGVTVTLMPLFGMSLLGIAVAVLLQRQGVLATLLGLALIIVPMRSIFSTTPVQSKFTAALARTIESGTQDRRIAILLIFGVGLLCLLRGIREIGRVKLAGWAAIFLLLSFLSLLWSENTVLTLRRATVTLSVFVFAIGVGSVYYGRKPEGHIPLIRAICLGSLACSVVVLCISVLHHQFNIFDVRWRLGALGHENQIAWAASVGVMAAWATRNSMDVWPQRWLWRIHMGIPAAVLVMTKSRTTVAAVILSMMLAEFFVRKLEIHRVVATIVVLTLLLIAASTEIQRFWSRGEAKESIDSLSGRTELWHKVWADARERPLLGYGYGSYWSPRRVGIIADQWAPTSAHNGYLETTLDLGFCGLLLISIFTLMSLRDAIRLTKHPPLREMGVTLFMLTIAIVLINFGESYFSFDKFPLIVWLTCSFFVSHRLSLLEKNALEPAARDLRPCVARGGLEWNLR